jgi:nucleoside 2-deoxyribosyltransferase
MSKNTIYIAGPMRGYPRFNFDAFMEAEARLKEQGWHVLNPAAVDLSEGFDPDTAVVTPEMMAIFIKRDLEMVQQADAIALLPGTHKSKGAMAELSLAIWRGIDVYLYRDGGLTSVSGFDAAMEQYYGELTNAPQQATDEDILEEALRITRGDRQAQYGPPDQDFQRTARMWSALKGVEFTAHDVAMFMILLKCSRQTHQHKRDNWVDIAGYARCGSLIAN